MRQEGRGRAERARQRRRRRKEREKKRGREIRGDDRDGRSHMGDKRPCDAGWDDGEEKERRVWSAEKGTDGHVEWNQVLEKTCVRDRKKFPGIRVLGFRRNSSSTMKKKF